MLRILPAAKAHKRGGTRPASYVTPVHNNLSPVIHSYFVPISPHEGKKDKFTAKIVLRPFPDSKIHGANVGPTWGHQDPGGPHVGHMNLAIWVIYFNITLMKDMSILIIVDMVITIQVKGLSIYVPVIDWFVFDSQQLRNHKMKFNPWQSLCLALNETPTHRWLFL